jgi:hypothetical protein
METITKYRAKDGSEWGRAHEATKRDKLCDKIEKAMLPLGEVPKDVRNGKGWLQHELETVFKAKDAILEICREEGYQKHFKQFESKGRDCHPLSIIGRILNDFGGPLDIAWRRFARIDLIGREHEQCYYAYTNGPLPEHYCVEDRTK